MKIDKSKLIQIIKEDLQNMDEQLTPWGTQAGNVGTPGQPIQIRGDFKQRMINGYLQFGCNFLMNRHNAFTTNMAGLVPGKNPRWRNMLQRKLGVVNHLINRYHC